MSPAGLLHRHRHSQSQNSLCSSESQGNVTHDEFEYDEFRMSERLMNEGKSNLEIRTSIANNTNKFSLDTYNKLALSQPVSLSPLGRFRNQA